MPRAVLHEVTIEGQEWTVVCYAPPRPAALAVLTAAELEVVDHWVEGRSMRWIASARDVTVRTIAKQIASAYEKLGVSSRPELVKLLGDLSRGGG